MYIDFHKFNRYLSNNKFKRKMQNFPPSLQFCPQEEETFHIAKLIYTYLNLYNQSKIWCFTRARAI